MLLFPIGTRVALDELTPGTVIGHAIIYRNGSKTPETVYIVELDRTGQGWMQPDKGTRSFISVIVAHPDNVHEASLAEP